MELISKLENEFETAYEFLSTFNIKNEYGKLVPLLDICEEVWKEEIEKYNEGFSEEDYHINDFILEVVEGDLVDYLNPICDYIVKTQEYLEGCVYEIGFPSELSEGFSIKFFSIKFENMEELNNFYELKKREMV